MAPTKVKNYSALTGIADTLQLLGYRNFFVPGGPGVNAQAITFGLVSNPAETTTPTEKVVSGAPFGPEIDVATFLSKVERTRTFESSAGGDNDVRALHTGGVLTGPSSFTTYATSKTYTMGAVVQTTANSGAYFAAQNPGTSGSTAPNWPTTADSTVNDNGITWKKVATPNPSALTTLTDGNASSTGMLIEIYSNSQPNGLGEIYVAPNVTIRGDGRAAGLNGTDETRLKFAERVLGVSGYVLPTSIGVLPNTPLAGGFLILDVPRDREDAILDALISGS